MFHLKIDPKHVAQAGVAAEKGVKQAFADMFRLENKPKHVAEPEMPTNLPLQ